MLKARNSFEKDTDMYLTSELSKSQFAEIVQHIVRDSHSDYFCTIVPGIQSRIETFCLTSCIKGPGTLFRIKLPKLAIFLSILFSVE